LGWHRHSVSSISRPVLEGGTIITAELLEDKGVLILSPKTALTKSDFGSVARTVDSYILEKGKLIGVMIEAPSFPGWDSAEALIEHLRFVREHHRKIDRIAAVTDRKVLKTAIGIAEFVVHPEFRTFAKGERERALTWLKTGV
jgi:hypothetical protein